jgi:hypothetical protein
MIDYGALGRLIYLEICAFQKLLTLIYMMSNDQVQAFPVLIWIRYYRYR